MRNSPQEPRPPQGPDWDGPTGYREGRGFPHQKAVEFVRENGGDKILGAKEIEQKIPKPPIKSIDAKIPVSVEEIQKGLIVSRHGEPFNPDIHAQLPTGDPATDSAGRFISKENHYAGPQPTKQFPQ